ncbi:MAG: triose-phosphate isomerase, partial [Clostridiales Family XIII bacterium]|nr:triose-phosphate isomerase [Clostridiales Family XIII bacterium]
MARKYLIAGNWKMYKTVAEARAFAREFKELYGGGPHDVAVIAPFTQLAALKEEFAGTDIAVGAQNMHYEDEGAYTGEISPPMLAGLGVDCVVIGHSERRQYFAETDETVNLKLKAAIAHGFLPIVCVGENLAQRDAGAQFDVVKAQTTGALADIPYENIGGLVIAYEPVWAIGTGRTATPEQAEEICGFIRRTVAELYDGAVAEQIRILYGGSVKPANAAELLAKENIDGALVGGASLSPTDFAAIATS